MLTTTHKMKKAAAALLGKQGGLARARKLTAAQRKASAKKAAKARWKNHQKKSSLSQEK